jgi:hypothetical protein
MTAVFDVVGTSSLAGPRLAAVSGPVELFPIQRTVDTVALRNNRCARTSNRQDTAVNTPKALAPFGVSIASAVAVRLTEL